MTELQFVALALLFSLLGAAAILYWNVRGRHVHRRGRRRVRKRRRQARAQSSQDSPLLAPPSGETAESH